MINNRTILRGDVLEKLAEIPDGAIDCIISSPPYWGLRDYGVEGQLGLEPDFHDYLRTMSRIMDELKRVLKGTGSCWINLGDTYAGRGKGDGYDGKSKESWSFDKKPRLKNNVTEKSRMGIPERFYINCIDSGWIARNHIPWYKANAMPSSVKDRFTNKWESVFFFAKKQKYYFNLDAVREKTITDSKPFNLRVREAKRGHSEAKLTGDMSEAEDERYDSRGEIKKQDQTLGADGKPKQNYKGFNERWKEGKWQKHYDENGNCLGCGKHWSKHTVSERAKGSMSEVIKRTEDIVWCNPKGKNPGDVFFINPKPFPEAHFATFPVELPLRILRCACPPGGIVLDPFFGAGTVGVAAEQMGLRWCGIELSEKYVSIAEKRLEKYRNYSMEAFA